MLVCAFERLFAGRCRTDANLVKTTRTNPSTLSVQNGKDVIGKHESAVFILGIANDSERLGIVFFFFIHN